MPSPFPGMDPYLERPALWPGVHNRLVAVIGELLAPAVAPRYWVDIEERLYVEQEALRGRGIRPDVTVSREGPRRPGHSARALLAPEFQEVAEAVKFPVRETYLVILDMPGREVVTVLEILSPSNKRMKGHGMSEYIRKRDEVLGSETSLVEIDLLREGERPLYRGDLAPHDYLILVHRGWERPRAWAAGWRLADPIPAVPVPLGPEDPAVFLDLAQALRLVYDRGAYPVVLDYTRPPDPPLPPEHQAWLQGVVSPQRP